MSVVSSNAKFTLSSYPFNYLVIENLFDQHIENGLSLLFAELIQKAKPIGKVGEVGNLIYDALSLPLNLEVLRSSTASVLASVELKELIASSLQIRLDNNIMLGMHRHNPPSKAGWSHTDFAVVSFPNIEPNFNGLRVFHEGCGCEYSDDSRDRQPNSIKTARAVACLYYIGNPTWKPGMGGETGVLAEPGSRVVASVPPRNNSLLVFEISPISYHAYLGSPHAQRNCFIWWYHSAPNYLLHRHTAAAESKKGQNQDPWDRWTNVDVPKFDTSSSPH